MTIKAKFQYHGGSFAAGVISAMIYSGDISPWWFILAAISLFSFYPLLQWKNDGRGWRITRAPEVGAEK